MLTGIAVELVTKPEKLPAGAEVSLLVKILTTFVPPTKFPDVVVVPVMFPVKLVESTVALHATSEHPKIARMRKE